MEKDMDLENNCILMDLFMKENFIMINNMDMVELYYLMVISNISVIFLSFQG